MNEVLELLHTRRSVKAADMSDPGPDPAQIQSILTAAARVPDHGKTVPFYFLVFEGDARTDVGQIIAERFKAQNPDAPQDKIEMEASRFLRAPTVIAVIHRIRRGKHPQWEQIMTCGAVCQNLILAATAHGFAAQWLSEWYAYDEEVRTALGLDERDTVAGFIHIGSSEHPPEDRERPELSEIITYWKKDAALTKGDVYDRDKFDYPALGMAKTL